MHPDDRENLPYANVELSLHRLSPEMRERIEILSVSQDRVHLAVLSMLTGLKPDEVLPLSAELIKVGLAEDMGDGHLRLDPDLAPYLLKEIAEEKIEAYRERFAETMAGFTGYLYQQQFRDAQLAARLTRLQLSSLIAMLQYLQQKWPPERVVGLANNVEKLLAGLDQPSALAFTVTIREQAIEKACRQSLAKEVRKNNLAGQASTLNQLGSLYGAQNRLQEAAESFRQSAELREKLGDLAKEGESRSDLANTLIKLQRFDQARQQIERALECKKPYDLAAQPWNTWSILEALEHATDNQKAALAAREKAIKSYLAYRRAGGASETQTAQLMSLVAQSIRQNQTQQVEALLTEIDSEPDTPPFVASLFAKLKAILAGARGVTLAADPDLQYQDAAELVVLLESLSKS